MRAGNGQTVSYWRATATRRERAPLREDLAVPVAVVGAGIAGLSVAYALARAGTPVCVIDRSTVGGGMTERTSAHLASAVDDRFKEIERRHGAEGARICAASHGEAIRFIADAVAREDIACGFERVDGYLFSPEGADERLLGEELEAARRAGLAVDWVERAPFANFDTGRCLRFRDQAQFHPLDYLSGLADAIERLGGRVYCGTNAVSIEEGTPIRVVTEAGPTILAGALVVATNTPINDRVAMHTKQAPYTTYVIAGRIPKAAVDVGLYWDTEDPYHYVRSAPGTDAAHRVLIVGGEDHKTGQQDGTDHFAALETWTRRRFPSLSDVTHRWSGQVLEPADGVAFIGRNPGSTDVYIATGDSGMGLTHGTIAGILIPELIQGRDSPWSALYDPSRKMTSAPFEYAKENLNVAAQYLHDYAAKGEVTDACEIAPGSGAIVRHGLALVAAYRDDGGVLHERSAVCPHLGCIVRWNAVEQTWDCPCHGSRFDRLGKVFNGPANRDLAARA